MVSSVGRAYPCVHKGPSENNEVDFLWAFPPSALNPVALKPAARLAARLAARSLLRSVVGCLSSLFSFRPLADALITRLTTAHDSTAVVMNTAHVEILPKTDPNECLPCHRLRH